MGTNGDALASRRLSIDPMIMYERMQLLHVFCLVLQYRESIIMNKECSVGDLAHETDAIVPLTPVFYELNVLRKRIDSIEKGYEEKYVVPAIQSFLKLN